MQKRYSEYLRAIHEKICNVCIEQKADGSCGLSEGSVCPIEAYLPRILKAVHRVESNRMEDYVDALRMDVCAQCTNQEADGQCPFRKSADCTLNRYFSLIVDAIDKVDEKAV
jgi:hypothetical protein